METAALKSFATWARRELLTEVGARLAAVLAPASIERVERPDAVRTLEHDIATAGGGETGRASVIDRVAYTWFNRIIALRFMDANGYTGVGVVSPAAGQVSGQPEILADAKQGRIDTTVVQSPQTLETITALLDGVRPSRDPQAEVYRLLLTEYCRHWHRAMPFMFEQEGDYTELLLPGNLLADGSVLSRAVETLSVDRCTDKGDGEGGVEVIGWLYQFYISERKDEVFAGFKKGKKAGAAEIPAATQLFTPHWIVRYLVENSVGRLWMLNHPESRLVDRMDYYIAPVDEETDFLKLAGPEELTVMDPACGSGHMLTYAFDLLYDIYEEEGYPPSQIPALILEHNLYGLEIDPRAGALAAFALTMKARAKQRRFFSRHTTLSIHVLESIKFQESEVEILVDSHSHNELDRDFWNQFTHADTVGSLIKVRPQHRSAAQLQTPSRLHESITLESAPIDLGRRVIDQLRFFEKKYSAVVTNPPYMGMKNASEEIVNYLRENYPEFKSDLFSAFVSQCAGLCLSGGLVGVMSPNVWMYISSHIALRKALTSECALRSLIELPLGGFDGATVQICAFTFSITASKDQQIAFIRLIQENGTRDLPLRLRQATKDPESSSRHMVNARSFDALPGRTLIYWLADQVSAGFASGITLSDVSYTRIGLITGDNARHLRQWFEVSQSNIGSGLPENRAVEYDRRWFSISKGGEYRKWYGNITSVVNWWHDGRELQTLTDRTGTRTLAHNFNLDDIFKEGVTWSKISSGRFSARYHPAGFIFNDPSAAIFPKRGGATTLSLLAYLASNVADSFIRALNPTLNFQPGNVSSLPWATEIPVEHVERLARRALNIAKEDWDEQEVSHDFMGNPIITRVSDEALSIVIRESIDHFDIRARELLRLEQENNEVFSSALGIRDLLHDSTTIENITLVSNPDWTFAGIHDPTMRRAAAVTRAVEDLVSYAVGCMFGRYSLDEPGLILADQGATLQDYLRKVPDPSFLPDADNVIPIVDGEWFQDDVVARFRAFLRAAFGDEHFEENLRFVEESLGVKRLRDYFITRGGKSRFYEDHVKRYKKRPIYWLFSSPKGSFNALVYLHRYTPATVSTVLNEYLHEYEAKLRASLETQERLAVGDDTPRKQAAAAKEAERLRKVLLELDEYERDVLYPLATRQLAIDLDDGVKANYPKFGRALRKIPGLEASE